MIRIAAIAVLFLFAGMTLGCLPGGDKSAPVETAVVERDDLEVVLEEIGVVEATKVVQVTAPFRGKLIQLTETGDSVEKGDVVLVMEDEDDITDLEDRLEELKTARSDLMGSIESLEIAMRSNTLDVDFAESRLAYERAKLEDVNTRLAETSVLLQKSVVPADDLRSAESSVVRGRLNTVSQDLGLRSEAVSGQTSQLSSLTEIEQTALRGARAKRRLEDAQERIESSTIRAEVSGLFLRKKRWEWSQRAMVEPRPGDTVRTGQVVGEIPDLSSLILRSQIPELDLGRVKEGAAVRIEFDAYGGLETTGRVRRIGKVAIERETSAAGSLVQTEGYSGQKVFEVEISFDQADSRMKPGITARISIVVERHEDVISVPVRAIQRRAGEHGVYVMDGSGEKQWRTVSLGVRGGDKVVIESGLRVGERVVLSNGDSPPAG